MLRSMLIGLDGSDDCLSVVDLGISWAKKFDSLLIGIGVIDEPAIRGHQTTGHISPSYQVAYDQLLRDARHDIERVLEQFAIRCSEEQVACKLLEDEGQPCERIVAELQRYDVLLLGCKTHFTQGSEKHPCKTLERVLRNSPRPVIAVPRKIDMTRQGIVVAYDGSVPAARALQALRATGLSSFSPIQVVSVDAASSVDAARTAEQAVEYLRFHDIDAERVSLVGPSAVTAFLDYAERVEAALIVMGAYGQPRMREFFFGSATCAALEKSSIPLFLYH